MTTNKIRGALANKKLAALTEIETEEGTLVPETLVEVARDVKHPLHDYFEWDDTIAGHKYRIDQARTLIRSLKVVVEAKNIQIKHAYYVHDPELSGGEAGYASVARIKTQEEIKRDAMQAEVDRAVSALKRAQSIAEGLGLDGEAARMDAAVALIES